MTSSPQAQAPLARGRREPRARVKDFMAELQSLPTLKVLLHAAKYPHAQVTGLLLGPKNDTKLIDDAIPLFHHTTPGPLLETAFLLVEQYANANGKRLAGYYFAAAEAHDPSEPPAETAAVWEQLHANYPESILLRVINAKLAAPAAFPFEAMVKDSIETDKWALVPVEVSAKGVKAFDKAMAGGAFATCRSLVDMDEHLDDAKRDFRNLHLQKLLSSQQ